MAIETATYIADLDATLPTRSDFVHEGDDVLRLIKEVLQATFTNFDQALDLDTLLAQLTPPGVITAYYAEAAPAGWALCDGGTYQWLADGEDIIVPDLRGKFVLAADARAASGYEHASYGGAWSNVELSGSGGSHTHSGSSGSAGGHSHTVGSTSLSISQMPSHNHGGGNHNHGGPHVIQDGTNKTVAWGPDWSNSDLNASGNIIASQGGGGSHTHSLSSASSHTHSLSVSSAGSHTHNTTVETASPYYALTYIFKL